MTPGPGTVPHGAGEQKLGWGCCSVSELPTQVSGPELGWSARQDLVVGEFDFWPLSYNM